MSTKKRFTFLIRPEKRKALRELAEVTDRSEGATIRQLIRHASREIPQEMLFLYLPSIEVNKSNDG